MCKNLHNYFKYTIIRMYFSGLTLIIEQEYNKKGENDNEKLY